MALQERTFIDQVEHRPESGHMQIRRRREIYEDTTDEVRSRSFHRRVVKEGDEPAELTSLIAGLNTTRGTENTNLKVIRQAYDRWVTDQALTPPTDAELRALAESMGLI